MGYSPWGRKSQTRLSDFLFLSSHNTNAWTQSQGQPHGRWGDESQKTAQGPLLSTREIPPEGLLCTRPSRYGISFHPGGDPLSLQAQRGEVMELAASSMNCNHELDQSETPKHAPSSTHQSSGPPQMIDLSESAGSPHVSFQRH